MPDNVQYQASGMHELMPASEDTYGHSGFRTFLSRILPGGGNKEVSSFVIPKSVVRAQEVWHGESGGRKSEMTALFFGEKSYFWTSE